MASNVPSISPDKQPTGGQPSLGFIPLRLSQSALRNGMRWVGGPGTGKTRGIALTVVWPHLWHAQPAIVIDPTGALCANVLNKVAHFDAATQAPLWSRIRYVDMAAEDYIVPWPLYKRQGDETLFAIANRLPEVLKRLDPDLTAAPILGWNSLFECAIYAGQIAAALGRQLDFVADLITQPQQHKETLRMALQQHPELARAITYFRALMDPNSRALRERRTGSFFTKLVPFLTDPLLLATFSTHRAGIDWAAEIRKGHTVLLDFGGETDRERRQFKLVWSFLELVAFIKERGLAGHRQPLLLVIDEISALLGPHNREGSILADDLQELVTVWARNVGLKLCLAHQYPSQLNPTANHALLQLGTQIIGNIQHPDDALDLARQFHRYDPQLVRKREPVWMNVQEGLLPPRSSVPRIIDERTIEYSADEQFLLVADAVRSLPKFHFIVRPALDEGSLTGTLSKVSLAQLDAGLYPNDALVAEARRQLRRRDGVASTVLLDEIAQRQQQAVALKPPQQNVILTGDGTHAQTPHPLPSATRSKRRQKTQVEAAAKPNGDAWQEELWQKP